MQRQARAPQTQPLGAEAFESAERTILRWLGMAGFLINNRGTTLMVDPLLGGFDMPVMIGFPIAAGNVPTAGRRPGHAQRQRPLQRPDLPAAESGDPGVPLHPVRRRADGSRKAA